MVTVVGFFLVGNHENDGLVTFATFVLQKVWKKLARVPPYFFYLEWFNKKCTFVILQNGMVPFCRNTKWHLAFLYFYNFSFFSNLHFCIFTKLHFAIL